jgi:hypothetical protein
MGLMRKLMCDHAWFNLVPDLRRQIVLTGCGEGGTHTPAAISRDREVALVYVPEGKDIVVNTAAFAGTTTELTWFDPRTGRATPVGVYPAGELISLKVPRSDGDPDFVLVMKRGRQSRDNPS